MLRPFWNFVIAACVFFAVATSGFAHHFAAQDTDLDLVAYLEAIGAADDFCGDFDGSRHAGAEACEACLLTLNAFLSDAPSDFAAMHWEPILAEGFDAPVRLAGSIFDLSHPTRGPPKSV